MMIRFLTLFIFPLTIIVFVPWIPDFYDTGRLILTTGLVMMILFFWILSVIRTKRCIFSLNAGSIGFGLLFLTSVISTLVISKNKIEALTNPLGPVLWLDLFLMSTFAPSFLKQEDLSLLRWVTAGCIAFLGLTATYQQFKITSILFPNASYLASNLWNPTGSPVSVILLAIAALPVTALLYRTAVKSHNDRDSAFAIIFFLFDMITICITLWRFLPSAQTVILPLQLGWTVLLETWKQVQYASIGIGAEQFVRAYTAARPVWVNTSPVWNTMFATNATLILHFGVVYGMLGVCACITLCIFLIKNREHSWEDHATALFLALAFFLLPPSLPLVIFTALFTIFSRGKKSVTHQLTTAGAVVFVSVGLVLFSSGVIFLYRFTAGEFLFQKTIHAIEQENNGTKAYNTAILALRQNPAHTKIHQTFSQINLLLAQSVIAAAREKQQSAVLTLSDEDKNLVTTLMTQSVREAKTATALSPSNVYAWGNLANIYQNLIGTAIEADQWAVAAYQKAISLDPTNPVLHLDLGGVYTTLKNTDSATREYVTAVSLKPNYTNGYYNLANVYKLKGDTASARKALDQVLLLLPKDSPSYHQVTEELKNLNAPTPEQNNESTRSPELTKPQIPTRPLIVPELTVP